ncbi:hypothetical protein ABDD95_19220 [Mucilaginibacter sp. PAMB04274]|uniref:hypothetical protein n=1 Tax=Mucilaginibacter sp. PAMB04274 TaxID=3138568 RepID=UPI0031F6BC9D
MVIGLDRLRSYFENYQEHYIIIGGTACEIRFSEREIDFRATKDIDMLLIVEALDRPFQEQFWKFIRDGKYVNQFFDGGERRFFRFSNPQAEGFPVVVELFSRKPDGIELPEDFHLTPVPTDEALSSLSAMLLHDEYYQFTLTNCDTLDQLRIANERALIVLKVKAFLNNRQRKAEGQQIQQNDIDKHKKDILKLVTTLSGEDRADAPDMIKADIAAFIEVMREEKPDIRAMAKAAGVGAISLDELLEQLAAVYEI